MSAAMSGDPACSGVTSESQRSRSSARSARRRNRFRPAGVFFADASRLPSRRSVVGASAVATRASCAHTGRIRACQRW